MGKKLGFINVDKPTGITSHDVVNKIRRLVGSKHVGHGGTLDPLARGVLPIAVGSACRLLRFLPQDKTYVAEILLGQKTTTDDIEGDVIGSGSVPALSINEMQAALSPFSGLIDQVPPLYSAVHVEGKRSYELARAGQTSVQIKPRQVTIYKLDVLDLTLPILKIRVACSSGTYIRSIARDLGESLGCGGCLQSLVREQAGLFCLPQSHTLEKIAAAEGDFENIIIDPVRVLQNSDHFHTLIVDQDAGKRFAMGQSIALNLLADKNTSDDKPFLITYENQLIALCNLTGDGKLKPEVVMAEGQEKMSSVEQ